MQQCCERKTVNISFQQRSDFFNSLCGIEKKTNLNQVLNFIFFPLLLVGKLLTLKSAEDVSGHSLYILMMQELFSLV